MKKEQFLLAVESHIRNVGLAIHGVFDPDGKEPTFAYTIGNCTRGLPELVMAGLPPGVLQSFLNDASFMMRDGELTVVDHLETDELAQGYKTVFRRVPKAMAQEHLNELNAYCRWKDLLYPEVFQLVFPDAAHRFPWEPGFDEKLRDLQPVWYDSNA